jgi:hypothetical protein
MCALVGVMNECHLTIRSLNTTVSQFPPLAKEPIDSLVYLPSYITTDGTMKLQFLSICTPRIWLKDGLDRINSPTTWRLVCVGTRECNIDRFTGTYS